jgi:hypothetical protein
MPPDAFAKTLADEALATTRAAAPARAAGTRVTFSDAEEDEAELELLARRVAWFGFGSALLSGGFLAYRLLSNVVADQEGVGRHTHFINAAHAGSVVFYLGMALAARRPRLRRHLRAIEAVGLVGGSSCLIAMSAFIPLWVQPRLIALLGLAITMFVRAAFVPSTGRNTAILGAVVAVPLCGVTFTTSLAFDPATFAVLDPALATKSPRLFAAGMTFDALAWWFMVVVASTAASRVIYGLRNEVRAVRKLGRYHLEERLGAGGMGVVYRARHALLDRPMAVKVLPPARLTEEGRRRFAREVQLTAQLRHPSTISVLDYGRTADGLFYYTMEYVEGATLAEIVAASGRQPPARVIAILRAVVGALVEAHGLGLVHRDLKPANVMVQLPHRHGGVDEVTKVLDFGLVKDTREPNDAARTKPGTLRGTPQYLAPESIKDPDAVGPASDLYALGAVGYFLLCGVPVFEGDSVVEVCAQHLRDEPIPPSLRTGAVIDAPLEELILSCLRKRPDDRPRDALTLERLLSELEYPPWTAADASSWWAKYGAEVAAAQAAERASVSEDLDPLRGSTRPKPAW